MNREESALHLLKKFIEAINQNDFETLSSGFQISREVYEEICEELNLYFKNSVPPLQLAEESFEMFKYNNGENFGIEVKLETKEKSETELTLRTQLCKDVFGNYSLLYRLINVM